MQYKSNHHFTKAFKGFEALEKNSHDDKLQYRLGWMLQNGIGSLKDIAWAKEYFEKSAKVGNIFAGIFTGEADSGRKKSQSERTTERNSISAKSGV
ncbi:MAG: hypothetical protein ACYDG2_18745 [Ruminiclostridium sp.]